VLYSLKYSELGLVVFIANFLTLHWWYSYAKQEYEQCWH